MRQRYWFIFIVMALLSPLGLLAEGTAWGEWGGDELQETLGYIPQGMEQLGNIWQALFPDYSMNFLGQGIYSQYAGYILSAAIGSALIYCFSMVITKLLIHQKNKPGLPS